MPPNQTDLDDMTLPSRPRPRRPELPRTEPVVPRVDAARPAETLNREAPMLIQRYLHEHTDLDRDLAMRFPGMPLMSQIHTRTVDEAERMGLATIATQDGAASLVVEVDANELSAQFMFVLNSMIGFKFNLSRLSEMDYTHWFHAMRGAQAERNFNDVVFLWGASRWNSDYLVFAPRKHVTNVYAFSSQHVECAARLTVEVTNKLLTWLEPVWTSTPQGNVQSPHLSSW